MAHFLRDQHVHDISLNEQALTQISNVFSERHSHLLEELKSQGKTAFFAYIIRFDNKGYRVFSLDELLRYFNQAGTVERVIFTIESDAATLSNRVAGAYLELCLDAQDANRCSLVSSSDTKDWAEVSFSAVHEVLAKHQTKHWIARNRWIGLLVQLFGVALNFVVSLWLAFKVAPNLKIENGFVIAFLFILLLFGNIWGYLNQALLGVIAKLFPNIEFIRPRKAHLHWLLQAIVGSATFAVVVFALGHGFDFLFKVGSEFFTIGR